MAEIDPRRSQLWTRIIAIMVHNQLLLLSRGKMRQLVIVAFVDDFWLFLQESLPLPAQHTTLSTMIWTGNGSTPDQPFPANRFSR